jgi:hypothetical protein
MSSHLDPVEIEQAKPHALKCPTCKANLMIRQLRKYVLSVGVGCQPQRNSPLHNNPLSRKACLASFLTVLAHG